MKNKNISKVIICILIIAFIILFFRILFVVVSVGAIKNEVDKSKEMQEYNMQEQLRTELQTKVLEIYAKAKEDVTREKLAEKLEETISGVTIEGVTNDKILLVYNGFDFEINNNNMVKAR